MKIASVVLHGVNQAAIVDLVALILKATEANGDEIDIVESDSLPVFDHRAPSLVITPFVLSEALFAHLTRENSLQLVVVLSERRAIKKALQLSVELPFELLAQNATLYEVHRCLFALERQLEHFRHRQRLMKRLAELELELNETKRSLTQVSKQLAPLTDEEPSRSSTQQEYSLRRIEESIDMAQRYGVPLSCLLVGLRHSDGRPVDDNLLARIAGRLKRCVRSTDLLTLFGQDQFLVLSPFTGPKAAIALANRLFAQMTERELSQVEMRIGVSNFERPMKEPKDLMLKAEQALETARASGVQVSVG